MLSRRWRFVAALSAAALVNSSCGRETCARVSGDCPVGSYCVLDVSGTETSGFCTEDCFVNEDCGTDDTNQTVFTCTSEGRCLQSKRPPNLRVLEPENDTLLAEGTRAVRISGEIETAAEQVVVSVRPETRSNSCVAGFGGSVVVRNPQPGELTTIPFVINDVEIDPGLVNLSVIASLGARDGVRTVSHLLEVPCEGCATIEVETPAPKSNAPGLLMPRLVGAIAPASVTSAIWRVRSESGDVFDGRLAVEGGRFAVDSLPLFAGSNRVEIVVTGVGAGLGENRCSLSVSSGVAQEDGLRSLLSWDGTSADLDVHVVGPGGRYGDLMGDLSAASPAPAFGGEVRDDFDGLGPEVHTIENLRDGVYGFVIEPVFDDEDRGSNAVLRVLVGGRPVTRGPIGPEFMSDTDGRLWVAGTLRVVEGRATWTDLGDRLEGRAPPTRPPADWPNYY